MNKRLSQVIFTLPQPNYVLSAVNELNEVQGNKSLVVQLSLTSTNTKLSPVKADLKQNKCIYGFK